jgi:F0F1-type ATP synthase assembly protein I
MSVEPEKPELPSDAEIEERFSKIKENLTVNLDDVDQKLGEIINGTKAPEIETDELDQRLEELARKAEAIKERKLAADVEAQKQVRMTQDANAGLGMGLTIAYAILGVPLAGALVGVLVQRTTGNPVWMPVFTLAGLVFGVLTAVILIQRNNKSKE